MGRSFEVTSHNIKHFSINELVDRHNSLTRLLRKKVDMFIHLETGVPQDEFGATFLRLREEKELIEEHLEKKDASHLIAEQLSFPGMKKHRPKTYKKLVEKKLAEHYVRLEEIRMLRTRLEEGVKIIVPSSSLVASYGGTGGGTASNQSLAEKLILKTDQIEREWAVALEDLLLRIQPMQRALSGLDENQRLLIETKYLHKYPLTDDIVRDEIKFDQNKYYKVKKDAIYRLAESLHLLGEGE